MSKPYIIEDRSVGDFPLKDKVVAVTGGGSGKKDAACCARQSDNSTGICAAFCKRCIDGGAKGVVIGDLRVTDDAQELFKGINNIEFVKTDVTDWKQLENMVTVAKEKFGATPDVYVGGAGIFEPPDFSSFWHDPEDDNRYRNVEINLNHPIKFTRIGMRHLINEDKPGVILPIASVGGIAGTYHAPLYIATKHGIIGFVKSMKLAEKYEGVKIVTICPGACDSGLWTKEKRELVNFKDIESLKPDDVAKAMIELVVEGKHVGGTCMEIMPNSGPKTRVLPE